MSKKNKVVYSDIQPNAKEAGVWVNTTDGNVMVEKDGKWVDDGGSSNGGDDDDYWYIRAEDHSNLPNSIKETMYYSYTLVKERRNGFVCIDVPWMASMDNVIAFGLPVNTVVCNNGVCGTLLGWIEGDYPNIHNIPRMTKEEFYNLEV